MNYYESDLFVVELISLLKNIYGLYNNTIDKSLKEEKTDYIHKIYNEYILDKNFVSHLDLNLENEIKQKINPIFDLVDEA